MIMEYLPLSEEIQKVLGEPVKLWIHHRLIQ